MPKGSFSEWVPKPLQGKLSELSGEIAQIIVGTRLRAVSPGKAYDFISANRGCHGSIFEQSMRTYTHSNEKDISESVTLC